MSRYTDIDVLKRELIYRWNVSDDVDFNNKEVWQALEKAMTIDIVRCKECKNANTEDCSLSHWDDDWGKWRVGYIGDEWFCADGEREGE